MMRRLVHVVVMAAATVAGHVLNFLLGPDVGITYSGGITS